MLHKTSDSVEPAGGSHRLPSWEFSWHTGGRFGTWGSWHEVTSLLELTGPREPSPPPPTIARILVGISGALACSSSFCSSLQLWFLKKKKKYVPELNLCDWPVPELEARRETEWPLGFLAHSLSWKPCWGRHTEWTNTREQRTQREAPRCPRELFWGSASRLLPGEMAAFSSGCQEPKAHRCS